MKSFSLGSNGSGIEDYIFWRSESIKALSAVSFPNTLLMLPPPTGVAEHVHVLSSDNVYRLPQGLERVSLDLRIVCEYAIPVEAPLFLL